MVLTPNLSKRFLLQFFDKQGGIELMKFVAEAEAELLETTTKVVLEYGDGNISTPDIDDIDSNVRAEQLKNGVIALVNNNLPEFWAMEMAKVLFPHATPERVAELTDLSKSEWRDAVDDILSDYEGVRGTDGMEKSEIVEFHFKTVYGMDVSEFQDRFVFLSDDDKKEMLIHVLKGQSESDEYVAFRGMATANDMLQSLIED